MIIVDRKEDLPTAVEITMDCERPTVLTRTEEGKEKWALAVLCSYADDAGFICECHTLRVNGKCRRGYGHNFMEAQAGGGTDENI